MTPECAGFPSLDISPVLPLKAGSFSDYDSLFAIALSLPLYACGAPSLPALHGPVAGRYGERGAAGHVSALPGTAGGAARGDAVADLCGSRRNVAARAAERSGGACHAGLPSVQRAISSAARDERPAARLPALRLGHHGSAARAGIRGRAAADQQLRRRRRRGCCSAAQCVFRRCGRGCRFPYAAGRSAASCCGTTLGQRSLSAGLYSAEPESNCRTQTARSQAAATSQRRPLPARNEAGDRAVWPGVNTAGAAAPRADQTGEPQHRGPLSARPRSPTGRRPAAARCGSRARRAGAGSRSICAADRRPASSRCRSSIRSDFQPR